MRQIFVFALSCLFVAAFDPITMAENSRQWRFWTTQDGFEESACYRLTMGSTGHVYVNHGSVRNLNILDGYSLYDVPADYHSTTFEDRNGGIWSILRSPSQFFTGFQRYDSIRRSWIPFPMPSLEKELSELGPYPNGRFVPISSRLIVLALQDKVLQCDPVRGESSLICDAVHLRIPYFGEGQMIADCYRDLQGNVWIPYKQGVVRLHLDEKMISSPWQVSVHPFPEHAGYSGLSQLLTRKDGMLFGVCHSLSDNSSIAVQWDGKEWSEIYRSNERIINGWKAGDGTLWIATEKTVQQVNSFLSEPLSSMAVSDIVLQGTDSFFAATLEGLVRYTPPLWRIPKGIPEAGVTVNQIGEDEKGCLWFASPNTLFAFQDGKWSSYKFPVQYINLYLNTQGLVIFPKNRIMINAINATSGDVEVLCFDSERHQFSIDDSLYPNRLLLVSPLSSRHYGALIEEPAGSLFYASIDEDRLSSIIPSNVFQQIRDFGAADVFRCFIDTDAGNIWIGHPGNSGPFSYDGKELRPHTFETGCPASGAFAMLDTGGGKIWVGGRDEISEYDGHSWRIVERGFDIVRSMIQDKKKRVWVASGNGVHCYDPGKKSWIHYTEDNGLPSAYSWKVFEDSQGQIWVGTLKGICQFNPNADHDPPLIEIPQERNNHFLGSRGRPQFFFHGIDQWKYTPPERLLYSYRLDGGSWSEYRPEDTRTLDRHFPPGNHTLEVKAMDLNWNESAPKKWEFEVMRPWNHEPAFLWIVGVLSFLIVCSLGYAINRHFRLRHAYENLQKVNEELLELDQMKTAFVSQASHDLRTPLTAIKGSLDNLSLGIAGEITDKQKRILDRALKSVDRLTALVNDILDLNRIESGRTVMEKSAIPFKTLVENMIQEYKPSADEKRITLLFSSSESSHVIHADGSKIERVVSELVGNAIKYTPTGGVIHIQLFQEDQRIRLSVQDNGIGIRPEDRERIWERFYRTPDSKNFAKGSGLGLSIAKELVEMHGGTLTVKSEMGKGSQFTLSLPVS